MKALPLAFAWAAMAATASAQPGTLDPTFGSGGVATFTTSYDLVNPLTLHALSDGRFLSTGIIQNSQPSEYRVLLFRTDTNGQLDNGFGQQGLVAYAPQGYNAQGFSSLLRADGSVIVVGNVFVTDRNIAIWRFTDTGALDTGFGTSGMLTVPHSGASDILHDFVEVAPGDYVGCGQWADQTQQQLCLVKFDENGTLDAGFGTNGKVLHDLFPGEYELADFIHLNSDGTFLVQIARDGNVPVLARFLSDGQLDVSYGTNGWVQLPGDCTTTFSEFVVLPNGNTLISIGTTQAQFIQVDPDGALVSSFGVGGVLVVEPSSSPTQVSSILALPDGSWLGTGSINTPDPLSETMVCHYLPDGSLDTGFGVNGCFRQPFFNIPRSWGIVVDPNGRLVMTASNFLSTSPGPTHLLAMEVPITGIEELVANQQVRCGSGADAAFVDLATSTPAVSSVTFHDITGKLVAQVAPTSTSTSSSRSLQISYPTVMEPGCYVMRLQDRSGAPIGNCAVVKGLE